MTFSKLNKINCILDNASEDSDNTESIEHMTSKPMIGKEKSSELY